MKERDGLKYFGLYFIAYISAPALLGLKVFVAPGIIIELVEGGGTVGFLNVGAYGEPVGKEVCTVDSG